MLKQVLLCALALLVLGSYAGTASTADKTATPRGPVNTPKEKSTIEAKAQSIAGANKVDNQLEIIRR